MIKRVLFATVPEAIIIAFAWHGCPFGVAMSVTLVCAFISYNVLKSVGI